MNQRLRASQRMRGRFMFQTVFNQGTLRKGIFLNVWVQAQAPRIGARQACRPKLGLIVSRRTDSRATIRNLWKRRIREGFRHIQNQMVPGVLVLIQARKRPTVPTSREIESEMLGLLGKTGILV